MIILRINFIPIIIIDAIKSNLIVMTIMVVIVIRIIFINSYIKTSSGP